MNLIHKAFVFRLYPDPEQMTLLAKHFGCCRLLYNHFLCNKNLAYEKENRSLNYYDNSEALTLLKKEEDYHFLNEVNSQSSQCALKHLDLGKQDFRKISGI